MPTTFRRQCLVKQPPAWLIDNSPGTASASRRDTAIQNTALARLTADLQSVVNATRQEPVKPAQLLSVVKALPRQHWLKAAAAANAASRKRSGSILSAAGEAERRSSVRSTTPAMAGNRFADNVKQVSTPSWLSAGSGSSTARQPSGHASAAAPDALLKKSTAASDLVDAISMTLAKGSQAASPKLALTAARQRTTDGTPASRAGVGSTEIAQIEALLTRSPTPSGRVNSVIEDSGLTAEIARQLDSLDTQESRRQASNSSAAFAQKQEQGRSVTASGMSTSAKGADASPWGRLRAGMSSLRTPEQPLRRPEQQGAVRQPAYETDVEAKADDRAGDEDSHRSSGGFLSQSQSALLPPAIQVLTKSRHSSHVMQLLQPSYLQPDVLVQLRTKWMHHPSLPAGVFSLPGLR